MNYIFDNERPIYLQVLEQLRQDIISCKYKQGERLPSVRELAMIFKVNPNTMQRALIELENDKLIYTERTNGKFVTADNKLITIIRNNIIEDKIFSFLNDMKYIGVDRKEVIKYLQEREEDIR